MKKVTKYQFIIFLLFTVCTFQSQAQFSYVSPLPGSKYHHPETNLIFRAGALLDPSSVNSNQLLEITGSQSGVHSWKPVLAEGRILIIQPDVAFAWGETVQVVLHSLLRKADGSQVEGLAFSFTISNEMSAEQKSRYLESRSDEWPYNQQSNGANKLPEECSIDSLPGYQIVINNNPAPGQIFHNNQSDDKKDSNSFPTIIENDGTLIWACDLGISGHDFKINYNGYLTYFNYPYNGWIVLDSNLMAIDSIQCGNGYEMETNGHDIVMYPDGHAFVFAYNPQIVDMSQIVQGGKPDALVKGLVIQELNSNKEVIFQWRSWDHFLITDATDLDPLTGSIVDPVHGNAMEREADGHLLLSSRNMSEITKINLETGDIIWRMGGENNQFTFINDNIPQNFSHQHDIRRTANGNVTLFNNGVGLPIQQSSAKEYQLDEINKTATLVWYYEHPKVGLAYVYGTGSGSVQRLDNGNTLISWGKTINSTTEIPNYTEVDANNNITWEFRFNDGLQRGYRVHRYIWQPCEIPNSSQVIIKNITPYDAKIDWNDVKNAVAYDIEYRKLGTQNWKLKNTDKSSKKLINLKPESTYEFRLRSYCVNGYVSDWTPLITFLTSALRLNVYEVSTNFQLYPSPAVSMISLKFESEREQQAELSVYDLMGNRMVMKSLTIGEGGSEQLLDISALPGGFYVAEVKVASEKMIQRFIKQ
ncbi:MAG: aryl-sulfate sulfotransferase [Chitinophagaceae bacterium]|nr:aryl-sulfate sulfotransferase [Chitinophagaceae bacterium]